VRQFAKFVKGPLAHIYNMSINSGKLPEKFKVAREKPLYKKGDIVYKIRDQYNFLPIFSKILEKLLYSRLIIFLNKYNIITEVQNGFREQKSTTIAILPFTERIQEALDNGLQAISIFFYLKKACDVLIQKVLLDKLHS